MKSTRLPGKILLPIPLNSGKPLLSWIVAELKESQYNNEIIVATSLHPENDVLVAFCEATKISCFRGDEENVLSRFLAIVNKTKYDCVVRLTADNPIIDISILDETIENHFNNNNDYTKTEGMPVGMNFEIISPQTLLDIKNHKITDADKEHVTLFVKNSGLYKLGSFMPSINPRFKDLRLTIDYASDYSLLSIILTQYDEKKKIKGLALIEKIFVEFPWIFEINATNIQKKLYADLQEEIKNACDFLELHDFKQSAKLLGKLLE